MCCSYPRARLGRRGYRQRLGAAALGLWAGDYGRGGGVCAVELGDSGGAERRRGWPVTSGASLLGGVIYDALGPASVFVACAGALGLAMLIMIAAIARGVFAPVAKMKGR